MFGEHVDVVDGRLHDAGVIASDGAYGPVAADHEAIGTEGFEHRVEVRGEIFGFPGGPVGFCDHTREFAGYVWKRRECAKVLVPGRSDFIFDEGL